MDLMFNYCKFIREIKINVNIFISNFEFASNASSNAYYLEHALGTENLKFPCHQISSLIGELPTGT